MSEGYQPFPPDVPEQPFARIVELPDDLAEAVESLKLAILRHKFAGWSAIAKRDVVSAMKSLIKMIKAS